MRVLIVLAHPERASFNGQMADRAAQTLTARGHEVTITDLYRESFDPREAGEHYGSRLQPHLFDVQAEQRHASANACLPGFVDAELKRVEAADLVILQYPMWWFSPPAILKGWIERVLVYGRIYDSYNRYDRGRLKGRKAMISVTCGGPQSTFAHNGRNGDVELLMWPTLMSLSYVGMDVLPPYQAFGVFGSRSDPETQTRLQAHLDGLDRRLQTVELDDPLSFNGWADWDENGQLKPGVEGHSLLMRACP